MVGNTTDNDRANSPEHLQHLGSRSSQSHGHNLGAVGGCVGDKDTPRDTLQDLRSEEHAVAVTKVEDENEAVQGHQAADGRPSIPDPTGNGTRDEDTDEGTDGTTALECRLPRSLDDIFVLDVALHTKVSGEAFGGDELSHQEDTVGFHNL